MSKAREIHSQAVQAREDGDFLKALQLADQALIAYHTEGDLLGAAEIEADRFLTFRHLYQQSGDEIYLVVAKHVAMAGVEIVRRSGVKEALVLPLYNLAKAQEELGQLKEASHTYLQAIEAMKDHPPKEHDRPAVLADMERHLATCQLKDGDDQAKERALQAIHRIEQSEESSYNKNVWVSGGYLELAEILHNPEYLDKAKEIIDADDRLKIRLQQWQKIKDNF